MKIGIQTWGSHGDIRPFIALADGLKADGHDVTLAVTCVDSDRYSGLTTRTGVSVKTVATPVISDPSQLKRSSEALLHEQDPIKQTQIAIEQFLLPVESELFEVSERLCLENDLVIGHYFLYPLAAAAERHSKPHVSIALAHGAVPSAFQPPAGVPDLGAFSNRLAWRLARWVLNLRLKKYPDQLRLKNGMKPVPDMIDDVWSSKYLTLLAVSTAICEAKQDWPSYYHVCGVLDTQESVAEGAVPSDLDSFLSNGSAPVYMTFGSMISASDEKQAVALFTEAAETAGVRAIIQAPNPRELGFCSNNHVHYLSTAPHSTIFPRCCLVVHHGGAGTSQAALRAGKPSVIVAHTAEQELWGRELTRLGTAPPTIRRTRLTAGNLAAAIRLATGSPHLLENAKTLRIQATKENGVATAVKLINDRFAA